VKQLLRFLTSTFGFASSHEDIVLSITINLQTMSKGKFALVGSVNI